MSDTNKFINTYIDMAMATLHDNTNTIMQLRTKEKLTTELLQEKDNLINELNERLRQSEEILNNNTNETINRLNNELNQVRSEYNNHANNSNQEIARLNQRVTDLENEKVGLITRCTAFESENNVLKGKITHLDTAIHQVTEMKNELLSKSAEISNLKKKIEELSPIPPAPPKLNSSVKRKKNLAMETLDNDF